MKKIIRRQLQIIGILLLAVATPRVAQSGLILDQENVAGSSAFWPVGSDYSIAQTFTVGVTGRLDRISLQVNTFITDPSARVDLQVDFLQTIGGVPDVGSVIASITVPGAAFSNDDTAFIDIDLGVSAFSVSTGDVLAISLTAPGDFLNEYNWQTNTSTTYAGGGTYLRLLSGGGFVLPSGGNIYDSGFRTYVDDSPPAADVPEPSSLALLGIGVVSSAFGGARRSRRKRKTVAV